MNRREFLVGVGIILVSPLSKKRKKFIFKIKTKNKSIIGGITIEADDVEAAKYKLRQRYRDKFEILSVKVKN
jgi:hypothetical protein